MGTELQAEVRKRVDVTAVIEELNALEKALTSAKTYASLRQIIDRARALEILARDIDEVKQRAQGVILLGWAHVGDELKRVPKASGRPPKIPSADGRNLGREDTGIPAVSRHRLMKLSGVKGRLLQLAKPLWAAGKDATVTAILAVLKEGEIRSGRQAFESRRGSGGKVEDLDTLVKPGQRYPVIYADPPWEFKVYSGKGKQRSAERHYDTMTIDDIKALGEKVDRLAAEDAALFLWAVWPELPGALEVIASWGFEYKTAGFVWVKQVSETNPDPFTGMGYWTRANSEPCLLATRGSPQRDAKDVPQVIMAPVGEHSQKPDEARSRIERLLVGPYLELFGRDPVPGWTVWGNEVEMGLEAAE